MIFHYLHLRNWSIFEQLQLEEALLRSDGRNFFIISEGSLTPSMVMGISGKLHQHLNLDHPASATIPVIRRFSGGGTVVVDEQTLFVTFIGDRKLLTSCTPESILRWAEEIFKSAFAHEDFALRDHDFVIGEKKCGGNALYLQKQRWLLHTSFLWGFDPNRLNLLLHPPKMPAYRKDRQHEEFVCRLSDHLDSKESLLQDLQQEMAKRFIIHPLSLEEALEKMNLSSHRHSTCLEVVGLGS